MSRVSQWGGTPAEELRGLRDAHLWKTGAKQKGSPRGREAQSLDRGDYLKRTDGGEPQGEG